MQLYIVGKETNLSYRGIHLFDPDQRAIEHAIEAVERDGFDTIYVHVDQPIQHPFSQFVLSIEHNTKLSDAPEGFSLIMRCGLETDSGSRYTAYQPAAFLRLEVSIETDLDPEADLDTYDLEIGLGSFDLTEEEDEDSSLEWMSRELVSMSEDQELFLHIS